MIGYFGRIHKFDIVTQFRLKNLFLFCIGFFLITPILTDLKGEYLAAWVISILLIAEQLVVKTNRYFITNYTLAELYKIGIIIHVFYASSALLYFIDPLYMVIADSLVAITDIAVFNSYSIKLTNYLTDNYPDSMSEFQIVRNLIWADGVLIGLGITTVLTYMYPLYIGVTCFAVYNYIFSFYLFSNWNFYSKHNITY